MYLCNNEEEDEITLFQPPIVIEGGEEGRKKRSGV